MIFPFFIVPHYSGSRCNLEEIEEKIRAFIENFSLLTIASITGWDYIQSALATVA
jgi:peptidase E